MDINNINNEGGNFSFEVETVSVTEVQKPKSKFDHGKIARCLIYCLSFLLPIFALPLATRVPTDGKFILFYFGVAAALLFWLFDTLRKGEADIPKSILALSLWIFPVVWFFTSLFSSASKISFTGRGYEIDSFLYILFAVVASFLVSIFSRTEKKAILFYLTILASAAIAFLVQLVLVVFKTNILYFNVFSAQSPTLIGSWGDFAVFFGFIALVSLSLFDLAKFKKQLKIALAVMVIVSLLSMLFIGFTMSWVVFGISAMILTVYIFSRFLFDVSGNGAASGDSRRMIYFSFVVFLIAVFVVLSGSKMQGILGSEKIIPVADRTYNNSAWSEAFDVAKKSVKEDTLVGSGPGTFSYKWLQSKSPITNRNAAFCR